MSDLENVVDELASIRLTKRVKLTPKGKDNSDWWALNHLGNVNKAYLHDVYIHNKKHALKVGFWL